jgi:hypothetical protein
LPRLDDRGATLANYKPTGNADDKRYQHDAKYG